MSEREVTKAEFDRLLEEEYPQLSKKGKGRRNKYNARKVKYDGYTFDSKAEWRRYMALRQKEKNGEVKDLEVHPRYEIIPAYTTNQGKHMRASYYEADFSYHEVSTGWRIVEDVKGGKATQTPLFKLKTKLLQHTNRGLWFRVVEY